MNYEITSSDSNTQARRGKLNTSHGIVETPVFMPVGTAATVKAMRPEELRALGTQILLGNTYHLYLRPGHRIIQDLGGLHHFMNWSGPILTDSGGFQVFSLAKISKVKEEGVEFQSHLDGSRHLLTPELAIEIQEALGSDIMMVLDECLPYPSKKTDAHRSMELTLRWAQRCLSAQTRQDRLLFAIVQGGTFPDLRAECAERLTCLPFPGFALGGLSVGEPMELAYQITEQTAPLLPKEKPRYLMGVGMPEDIIRCIGYGIDMFDCVVPTRSARHGTLFTSTGRLNIRGAQWAKDSHPIEEACSCYTCRHYSRAYLRHLSLNKEILSAILNTIHNLHYFHNLLGQARRAIEEGDYAGFQRRFFSSYIDS